MKKILAIFVILSSLLVMPVSAYWNNSNNGWSNNSNSWDNWNPYKIWDPRYWMEELEQVFDNDDYWGNNNNYQPYRNYNRSYNGYNYPTSFINNQMPYQNNQNYWRNGY